MINLLIIDTEDKDWYKTFENHQTLEDQDIRIEQSQWKNLSLTSYSGDDLVVDLYPPNNPINEDMKKRRTIQPDYLLLRNFAYSMHPHDHRQQLYGLMHANIPSVNSLYSFYSCLERPIVYGGLKRIERRLGKENFPLIDQNYYSNWNQVNISPSFPIVVKVGHVHAGVGKMRILNSKDFHDFSTVLAVHDDYVTAEHFYEVEYDIRLLKIGDHYRAHRRYSTDWKKNRGGVETEDIEVTSKYKRWLDEVGKLFGGLDMFALDAIHTDQGEDIIIELNASAMGLNPNHKQEDMGHIRDLVLERMKNEFIE